jgi:hypothetical protein
MKNHLLNSFIIFVTLCIEVDSCSLINKVTNAQMKKMGWINYNLEDLNFCINKFKINTKERFCHFISVLSYESALGRFTEDIANCTLYEGRADLGNIQPGDGCRFKGAGYLQLTGRYMYQQFSSSMYLNNSNYSVSEKKFDYGTYEGEFRGDKIEGNGTFYYKDGYTYKGEFKNEKIEGKGILSNNKDYKYKGEFKNGKMEGKGKEYYKNGDIYEGDFKNGLKEGKGIYYYKSGKYNGDRYEGDWKNDKKDGNGIYYYHDGKREMGDYSNGNRIGKHVSLYKDGKVDYKIY